MRHAQLSKNCSVSLMRLMRGQARYYIAQNLDSPIDRRTLGFWYICIHCAPFYLQITGRSRA